MDKRLKLFTFIFTLMYFFSSTLGPVLAAVTYSYDQNGNMVSDGVRCMEYNEANQVKKVKECGNNQAIAEYVYDYDGNRMVKKVYRDGVLSKTVFSPRDDFEMEKIASTGATKNTVYYHVNGQLVGRKDGWGNRTFVHADHLGSTSVVTDSTEGVRETTKYDPWGVILSGGTKSKFAYTGQEHDGETGLNYYNARYYDPHLRRFTQPDDIVENVYDPQMLNRYSYVRNNPLRYTDPTGHFINAIISLFTSPQAQVIINSVTRVVSNVISKAGSTVASFATKAGNTIVNAARSAVTAVQSGVSSTMNTAKNVTSTVSNTVKSGGSNSTGVSANTNSQSTVLRGAQNPVVKNSAQHGIQMHKTYNYGKGYQPEYVLPSGNRIDGISMELRHIKELKPDNLRAIKRGYKQLDRYIDELTEVYGGNWTGEVVTYPSLVK